jgi:hypothetical protein
VLAAAALALVGLAPSAAADDVATIFPITEPVTFFSSNGGTVPVGYTCSVPTDARDALSVRLVQDDGAAFAGSTAVTCDGTRQSAVVDIEGEGPAGQVVHPGTGRVQVSLQGAQVEQEVVVVRPDNEPQPPVVTPSITVTGDVVFTTATQGSVTLEVKCNNWADGVTVTVRGEDTATGDAGIACAQEHTVVVPLTAQGTGFRVGTQTVRLEAQSIEVSLATDVHLVRQAPPAPPAPVKASVSLTANASPEKVTKGKKITVTGKVRRDGKQVKIKTALEFRPDDGDYAKVKSVTSSSKGSLKTTVVASRSGSFRFTYAGDATTKPAASPGDHILVVKPLPKPKTYKNCTALVKVYPHGVGKSGAHDKGGDVTDFTRDNKTYAKNKKSDRDKDGIACER